MARVTPYFLKLLTAHRSLLTCFWTSRVGSLYACGAFFHPHKSDWNRREMTVKSDRWIRRMAEEHQLIQPFDTTLVRESGGRRIISAGSSSYGYDMRLADDGFRVFSPIH